jgi:hypothetical protein
MSQTFFSKLDASEKNARLSSFALAQGEVTLWIKGEKEKQNLQVTSYDKERSSLVLESRDISFPIGSKLLCSFEFRGMNFFSEIILQQSIGGQFLIHFAGDFFKSERRNSYRLLTFPLYQVWTTIDLGGEYEGGNVIGLKDKRSQTGIFKSFLNLINNESDPEANITGTLRLRVQDLSTTGMAIHIGELELSQFEKGREFEKVDLIFPDEVVRLPKIQVMYVVPYVGSDKNLKKFKVGIRFEDIPLQIDQKLGKKINELLRANDNNSDFEDFIK